MSKSTMVAVVTGGNKGIGLAVVKKLCESFDGLVYLTSRNETLGRAAVEELNKIGLRPEYAQLDIDNAESIEHFHNFIKDKHGGLDVLVNNAGIAYKVASTEPIGVQASHTCRVNYFGTLAVCSRLFPLLRDHGRVVNMSSSCGWLCKIPGEELRRKLSADDLTIPQLTQLVQDFITRTGDSTHLLAGWPDSSYVVSKVAVSALTRIQQRQFNDDSRCDLVINHCHPGYVDTDMSSHKGPLTPHQGAVSAVYCALLPADITSPRGDYIWLDTTIKDWVHGSPDSA